MLENTRKGFQGDIIQVRQLCTYLLPPFNACMQCYLKLTHISSVCFPRTSMGPRARNASGGIVLKARAFKVVALLSLINQIELGVVFALCSVYLH